jgi:hypothetical protein
VLRRISTTLMNPASGGLLSGPAHFLHWGVVQISLANLIVILLMIVLFVLALLIPFPLEDGERHDVDRG